MHFAYSLISIQFVKHALAEILQYLVLQGCTAVRLEDRRGEMRPAPFHTR